MNPLSVFADGLTAVASAVVLNLNEKLAVAAETCSQIVGDYKRANTPYRVALLKEHGHKTFLCFTADQCVDAINRELADSELRGTATATKRELLRTAKEAIWRLANLRESEWVFNMLRNDANAALRHIREQFADDYKRTARYTREHNGYDLSIHDYACTIWLHLSAGGTWRSLDKFRGDSSVYSWLKTICQHCISDYVESCGYCSVIASAPTEAEADDYRDVAMALGRPKRRTIRFDDYEALQVADSSTLRDADFISEAPTFIADRIDEMPWDEWEKEFITDSVINGFSALDLTQKYGARVALMQGSATPYDRAWTDNRNSRMKRDLYAYSLAYMNNDREVLRSFARKCRLHDKQMQKALSLAS